LGPLSSLTALEELSLFRPVSDLIPLLSDLIPLASCTRLRTLSIYTSHGGAWPHSILEPPLDLSPLASCRLESLDLCGTRISDLAPLASCTRLESLDLSYTDVSDLAPLASCLSLRRLDATSTKIIDLSPLVGLGSLEVLVLEDTGVSDLRPLASLTCLRTLNIRDTLVEDRAPLSKLPLFANGLSLNPLSDGEAYYFSMTR
jgi:internalin A